MITDMKYKNQKKLRMRGGCSEMHHSSVKQIVPHCEQAVQIHIQIQLQIENTNTKTKMRRI